MTIIMRFTMYVVLFSIFALSAAAETTSQPEQYDAYADYIELNALMARTDEEFKKAEGVHKFVLGSRFVNASLSQRDKLAELYDRYKGLETKDPKLKTILIEIVNDQSASLKFVIARIDKLDAQDKIKAAKLETQSDILVLEQVVMRRNTILDKYLRGLFVNTTYQEGLGLDSNPDTQYLKRKLADYAIYAADRVEALIDARENLTRILAFANDEVRADVNAKLEAIAHKKDNSIIELEQRIDLMNKLNMDTQELSQFLVIAKGQLSGDLLDADLLASLAEKSGDAVKRWFLDNGVDLVWSVLLFIAVVAIFVGLSALVRRIVSNALDHSNLHISALLRKFFVSMSAKLVMLIGLLIALSQLGIEVGPMLAGLGMVGFIIGFALQDTLSNFASGMMILIYRPFDEGNLIETAGVTGTVDKLSLVATTILTFDNQRLVIPNSKIWGDVIRNVTAQNIRRVDMVFGIGYSDDIPKAEALLYSILTEHPKVLKHPEPNVKLHTLNESSVDFIVRPWTSTSDYWDVYWDVTKTVKQRFDEEGISIPFPQRDVHIHQTTLGHKEESE
jgi:small conductance mechanosensitive channel